MRLREASHSLFVSPRFVNHRLHRLSHPVLPHHLQMGEALFSHSSSQSATGLLSLLLLLLPCSILSCCRSNLIGNRNMRLNITTLLVPPLLFLAPLFEAPAQCLLLFLFHLSSQGNFEVLLLVPLLLAILPCRSYPCRSPIPRRFPRLDVGLLSTAAPVGRLCFE